ncbi:hypothetical protein COV19_03410 [Candidatus Woesearchaeota archaeon CG10_big_fil_rev_8_21_14_0_10_44_13]|nr:MAG: hypothetical protein COV19_03410 [Candidatus Woesearchaeota archaeon CG10_big_fil_rev_8_21_14_0_10_44_13]
MKEISDFIKNKIKGKSWNDKRYVEYIEDLIKLENWIRRPPRGMAANLHFHGLRLQYEKEYLAMLKEIDSKKYETEKQRLFEDKKEHLKISKELSNEERKDEKRKKELWLELGGKE